MKALLVLIFCISIIAFGVQGIGYSACNEPPIKAGESGEAAQANKYNCATRYGIFKIGLANSGDFVHRHNEEIIAVGTVFIAIFTVVLGLFTVNLASSTQRLVTGAERTERRQLRAYIHNISGIVRDVEAGKKPFFRIEIKNHGQTPAYRVRHTGMYTLAHFPWTDCADLPEAKSVTVMGPTSNSFLALTSDQVLTDEQLNGIKDGSLAIYFEGRVSYDDVFGKPHTTDYRLIVGGERGFPPDEALFSDIHGNEAD